MEQRLCLSTVSPIRQKSDGIGIADWLASSVPAVPVHAPLYLATGAVVIAISRRGRSGSAPPPGLRDFRCGSWH